MRILLLFFTISINYCVAQVSFDKSIAEKYEAILKKCNAEMKGNVAEMERSANAPASYVFYTVFQTDTLNKKMLSSRHDPNFKITGLDGNEPQFEENNFPFVDLDFCNSNLSPKDSLTILIGSPFGTRTILHILYKNSIATNLNLHFKNDSILKSKLTDEKFVNNLNIKTSTLKFTLSDSLFTCNNTIYGFADLETDDFCIKDLQEDNQVLQLRYRIQYYFKFKVLKTIPHFKLAPKQAATFIHKEFQLL